MTTCYQPNTGHLERANDIAQRFQAPLLPRRAFARMFHDSGALHLYVVAREHDELRDAGGHACFVQEGLLASKLTTGRAHPFLRAIGEANSVVDATLGLANDALHVATVLGCTVRGMEGSALLHALQEEGLLRLSRSWPAASLISSEHALAQDALAAMATGSVDVVSLDPMMSRPKKSTPSFSLLRDFAVMERASPLLLQQAARVARHRVVLKLGKGAPLPPGCPLAFSRCEQGTEVSYWVHDTH